MSRSRVAMPALFAAACLLLAGCFNTPLPNTDASVPAHWRQDAGLPQRPPVDLKDWWKAFHDPMIDRLIAQALRSNLDVAAARERLRAERTLYGNSMAPLRPHLNLHTAEPIDPDATSSYFVIGFDASWELGLFGREQATHRIAAGRLGEARSSLQAARVSLVAEVVRNVVQLRQAQREENLLADIVAMRRRQLELLRTRVRLSLADKVDLDQARAELASARADRAGPRAATLAAAQRLALLLGRSEPDPAWLKVAPVPQLGVHGPIAAPAKLLRTRPGIARAEARVVETAGELGIAHADMYPRIGLGASMLWSTNLATYKRDTGTNAIGTIGPMIEIPLFDWGMRVAHEHAQGHLLQAAVLDYRKAVLAGVSEVESALGDLQQQRQREHANEEACEAWKDAVTRQQTRRRLGLSSDLDDTDIRIERLRAELALASARSDRDIAYVALYKALGGAPPLPARDDHVATAEQESH